ncbi:MAG: 30S ribosomal protein S5 [Verrucomicrobiota bacterium]|nr:30S ribosomal protein S5 [Verrucomicrobiota bacterium]
MSETIVQDKKPNSGRRSRDNNSRRDSGNRRNEDNPFIEKLVHVNRTTKVVKGGRTFSFSALVVAGDGKGKVGHGFGKAKEVGDAIKKATEAAKRAMIAIPLNKASIPHEVTSAYCGGRVILRPASPGTGVIAGGGVRAVMEAVGIRDILTKSLGSSNPNNVVKATIKALQELRSAQSIRQLRGIKSQSN